MESINEFSIEFIMWLQTTYPQLEPLFQFISNLGKFEIYLALIPLIYWIYLLFTANMGITMDAATYADLASMVHSKGWTSYFSSGPNKEPLYPFVISFSMHVSDWLSISYQKIQTFFQIMCLFAGQLLMYRLLKKANIHRTIASALILYMGISPSLVNSIP